MQKRSFTAGGFSPDRGKREEMACAVRANPAEPGRWGGRTRRQNGAAEQGGKTDRQDGVARRSGKTVRQDGAARRSGRTERQDGAAGRGGRTGRQDGAAEKEGEDKAGSSQRTDPGRRLHKQKTGETIGPARFSTGIPTAGSRRTAKKRTEKRPGICKRPTHRFSIRCSDTGKGTILSARPPLVK